MTALSPMRLSLLDNSFKYKTLQKNLSSNHISSANLEILFQEYTTLSTERFSELHPPPPPNQCNYVGSNHSWFVRCEQCISQLENYCVCLKCFIDSHKHLKDHDFSIYLSNGAICDCGNEYAMKSSGFCQSHCVEDRQKRSKVTTNLDEEISLRVHLFFRHLVRFINDKTESGMTDTQFMAQTKSIDQLEVISEWLGQIARSASHLDIILMEELLGCDMSTFNEVPPETYDAWDQKYNAPMVPLRKIPLSGLLVKEDNEPIQFLDRLKKHNYILHHIHPIVTTLITENRHFRYIFFKKFIQSYFDCSKDRVLHDSKILYLIATCFVGDVWMVELMCRPNIPEPNLLKEILKVAIIQMPVVNQFYQFISADVSQYAPRSDIQLFPQLLGNENIIAFVEKDIEVVQHMMDLGRAYHSIKLGLELPNIHMIEYVVANEMALCNTIQVICKHQHPTLENNLFDLLCKAINQLELDDQQVTPHYPLYRMLSTFLLLRPSFIDQIKQSITRVAIDYLIRTIGVFHICKVNLFPNNIVYYLFQDKGKMLDLFLLQLLMSKLGSREFFNSLAASKYAYKIRETDLTLEIINLLIQILQCRATLTPTKDDIRYHFVQLLALDINVEEVAPKFHEFIFKFTTKKEILDLVHQMVDVDHATAKMTLKMEWWNLIDPYYPYHTSKNKITFKRINSKYQNIKGSYPRPPVLPSAMKRTMNFLDHVFLMQLVGQLLIQIHTKSPLVPENRFEPSEELINDLYYLIALILRSYKDYSVKIWTATQQFNVPKEIGKMLESQISSSNQTPSIADDCLLAIFTKFNTKSKESKSIFQVLMERWEKTQGTVNNELVPLSQYIFRILVLIDNQFKRFFDRIGLHIDTTEQDNVKIDNQKKSLSENQKKLSEKMKMQQQIFAMSNPLLLADENQERQEEEEEELTCIVCNQTLLNEPMSTFGRLSKSALFKQSSVKTYKEYQQTSDPTSLRTFAQLLEKASNTSKCNVELPLTDLYDEESTKFCRYLTSCGHHVHSKCYNSYTQTSNNNCPLCAKKFNITIPICSSKQSESVQIDNQQIFCVNLLDRDVESKWSGDQFQPTFLWKYVVQNLMTLELKSREYTVYSTKPYYPMSQADFDREYYILKLLFHHVVSVRKQNRVSTTFNFNEDPQSPLFPFIMTTYQIFTDLSSCDIKSLLTNCINTIMKDIKDQIEFLKVKITYDPWSPQSKALINDRFSLLKKPFLRQLLLFKTLLDGMERRPPIKVTSSPFTLEQFNDDKYLDETLLKLFPGCDFNLSKSIIGVGPTQSTTTTTVKVGGGGSSSNDNINNSGGGGRNSGTVVGINKHKPMSLYLNPIQFAKLPESIISLFESYIYPRGFTCSCQSHLSSLCLTCGHMKCITNSSCPSSLRYHECIPNHCSLFLLMELPLVIISSDQTYCQSQVYNSLIPSSLPGASDLRLDGSSFNTNFTIDNNRLKQLFIHYINNNEKFKPAFFNEDY